MSRLKPRGRPLDGWLVIDKPAGMTSTDVVNRVKRKCYAGGGGLFATAAYPGRSPRPSGLPEQEVGTPWTSGEKSAEAIVA